MSNYSSDHENGLDYVFAYMGAIYGASFNRQWEGMDLSLVRQVWLETLGGFLTYKPTLDYALKRMNPDFPPSALKFRDLCNAGPQRPSDEPQKIERQYTQAEIAEGERQKQIALEKLRQMKAERGWK